MGVMTSEEMQQRGTGVLDALWKQDGRRATDLLTTGFEPSRANARLILILLPSLIDFVVGKLSGDEVAMRRSFASPSAPERVAQLIALTHNEDDEMLNALITTILDEAEDAFLDVAAALSDALFSLIEELRRKTGGVRPW